MFQQWLLPDSALVVTDEKAINFAAMSYEPGWNYEGGFQFKKHYFGPKPGELKERRGDGKLTEEFKCVQFLDALLEVRFWAMTSNPTGRYRRISSMGQKRCKPLTRPILPRIMVCEIISLVQEMLRAVRCETRGVR